MALALGAEACSSPAAVPERFPDCQAIILAIPSNVLLRPRVRFPWIDEAEAGSADARLGSSLCAVLGVARDGKTQLQVQIWLDTAAVLSDGGGRSSAEVLGDAARSETAGFCMGDPATSGTPVTRSNCYAATLDGGIAGAALVHASAVIAVRIDATPSGQTQTEFQRLLEDEASSIADAVASTI